MTHYKEGTIECIDYLYDNMPREAFIGYLEGNIKKYMHRWRYKGQDLADLNKAADYLYALRQVIDGHPPCFLPTEMEGITQSMDLEWSD